MAATETYSADLGGFGRSSATSSEMMSPRASNSRLLSHLSTISSGPSEKSNCLLERISRLQCRLNERMAYSALSTESKKVDAERRAATRLALDAPILSSQGTKRVNEAISNGLVAPVPQPVDSAEIAAPLQSAKSHDQTSPQNSKNPARPSDSRSEEGRVFPSSQNSPRPFFIDSFRSKEEEIEFLHAELKNMQEKVVNMEKKALAFRNDQEKVDTPVRASSKREFLRERGARTDQQGSFAQTEGSDNSLSPCGQCRQAQKDLDKISRLYMEKNSECARLVAWIAEINKAVMSCAVRLRTEQLFGTTVETLAHLESTDAKRNMEQIMLHLNALEQYFESACDQLRTAHCLDNVFKAQAAAENFSPAFIDSISQQSSDRLFPQALLWVRRSLTLEQTLKDKEEEILQLRMHIERTETDQYKGKEVGLRPVLDLKSGEIEAEMSLLRGRVKALTHELEIVKSRSRTSKSIVYADDDDCLDERDEVEARHLEQYEVLGTGAFAEVFKGWWRRPVAIKKFRNLTTQSKLDSFAREVRIHRPLDHPGIVQFYGVCTDLPDMSIVLEYVSGTSFHKLCHERNGCPWDLGEILGLCLQLSDVMCYVHSQNVVHRDLKPPNVLVSESGFVKLIDFGLAYAGDPSHIPKSSIYAGTPVYLPPEVLREEAVTSKMDLYSFGVILWEMTSQDLPWKGINMTQMIAAVATRDERPAIPAGVRGDLRELIEACWAPDPEARPEFKEVSQLLRAMNAAPAPIRQRAQFQTIQAM